MRILLSSFIAIMVSLCIFATVKMWGQSQVFIDYKHPFTTTTADLLYFHKPANGWTADDLKNSDLLYLDLAVTADSIPVVLRKPIDRVRAKPLSEIRADVYLAQELKSALEHKKIIFNFTENPISGPEIVIEFIKAIDFFESRDFLILSPYDVPLKVLKEQMPTFLFGTSQPEILKIKALESLRLVEASTFRADVVVYPLEFYNRDFFTDILIAELNRRFRKFIIGPIPTVDWSAQKERALAKQPFAIIIAD